MDILTVLGITQQNSINRFWIVNKHFAKLSQAQASARPSSIKITETSAGQLLSAWKCAFVKAGLDWEVA